MSAGGQRLEQTAVTSLEERSHFSRLAAAVAAVAAFAVAAAVTHSPVVEDSLQLSLIHSLTRRLSLGAFLYCSSIY